MHHLSRNYPLSMYNNFIIKKLDWRLKMTCMCLLKHFSTDHRTSVKNRFLFICLQPNKLFVYWNAMPSILLVFVDWNKIYWIHYSMIVKNKKITFNSSFITLISFAIKLINQYYKIIFVGGNGIVLYSERVTWAKKVENQIQMDRKNTLDEYNVVPCENWEKTYGSLINL